MALIGILTEPKNKLYLQGELKKRQLEKVFFLTENTILNMHNVKFDIFLLGKKISKNQELVRTLAKGADYFIFNSDIKENLPLLEDLDLRIITYGYNQKATITASSVDENKMMICLQRGIENIKQKKIEPQEIEIEITNKLQGVAGMELVGLQLLYSS
jgi:hypothetical protein